MKYLQYIQGDSVNNWIDPGIALTDDTEIELGMSFTPTAETSNTSQFGGWAQWVEKVGSRIRTVTSNCYFAVREGSPTYGYFPNAAAANTWTASDNWTLSTPHTLLIRISDTTDQSDPTPKTCLYVDGTKMVSATKIGTTHAINYALCQNFATIGEVILHRNTVEQPCRLYYAKFWQGGTLVRDLVPVLDNGVATLYDKVTDTVFIPGGTVPFTAGPERPFDWSEVTALRIPEGDVVKISTADFPLVPGAKRIEYIQGNLSTNWIDTGVVASGSIDFEIKFALDPTPLAGANASITGVTNTSTSNKGAVSFSVEPIMSRFMARAGTSRITATYFTGFVANTPQTIKMSQMDAAFYVDGVAHTWSKRNVPNLVYPFLIGMVSTDGVPYTGGVSAPIKIYSVRLWSNDGTTKTLLRDFVPIKVGTEGYMYDMVNGVLYHNAGTEPYVCGPDYAGTIIWEKPLPSA